ncbi:hypothetical protein BH10PLA1_BH10PLA1_06550 [soil metagenome]
MFGIRSKLILGFGGLLAILLLVGLLGRASLQRYSGTLERIFRENYDSVIYGQAMKDAVDRLDSSATTALYGQQPADPATVQKYVADLESNVAKESRNITLPGEDDLVKELRQTWFGGDYDAAYKTQMLALLKGDGDESQRRNMYRTQLAPRTVRLREAAQTIIDINVKNMGFTNGQVKQSAIQAERTLYVLIGAGVILGVIFVSVISRSILGALGAVTASAREIERGNLDLIVPVKTHDELGQLAETFNAMASRLREFRRTDRAKLIRTQRTTQLALGSLPDAVAIISPEGRVELANDTAQKMFGLRPETQLADTPATGLADLFQRAVTERRTIQSKGYDAAIQIFNGQERFFLPTAVPIVDEEHSLAGVTLVLADVTNLRKLDEMKSGLLSVVSHELKTPLTSIRMATHLLLEERVGSLNAKQQELLIAARDDADRLHGIIENLLDMGRIESGRALVELAPVSPEHLVRDAVDEAAAAYRDKGVALETNVPDDLPPVMADADRISHVFSNLLNNALKYTSSGGQARISVEAADRGVQFTVEDTGVGIPAESLPRIFERFYRVPGQHGSTGAGLGLAIAKEIVEVHNGTISVESTPGQGSRFHFTLLRAGETTQMNRVKEGAA